MSSAVKAAPEAAEKTPTATSAAPAMPKVKDGWSALATAVNGSRTPLELIGKAGMKGWDVRPEPGFAWVPNLAGACNECGQKIGDKHTAKCFLGEAEEGEEYDGMVDVNDTTQSVEVPGWYALVRSVPQTGEIESIGATQREYTPVSFEKRAAMLGEIAKQLGAKCAAAGPLWSNTGGFISLKVPEPIKIGKVDQLEFRVVLIASLTPGRPTVIRFSVVRSASNTVQHFPLDDIKLAAGDDESTRHTEASDATAAVEAAVQAVTEQANKLKAKRMTLAEFEALCDELWKAPAETANTWLKEQHERRKAVLRLIFNGEYDMFAGIGKTRWAALQAISSVAQHLPHVEIKNDADPEGTTRVRAESALFGEAAKLCTTAFEKLGA